MIYRRRCGLSLSAVTSAYSADELFDDGRDRPDAKLSERIAASPQLTRMIE
jgi:hypothetical protein